MLIVCMALGIDGVEQTFLVFMEYSVCANLGYGVHMRFQVHLLGQNMQ